MVHYFNGYNIIEDYCLTACLQLHHQLQLQSFLTAAFY